MGLFISFSVIHQRIIHDYCGHDISPVFKKLPWITSRRRKGKGGKECLPGGDETQRDLQQCAERREGEGRATRGLCKGEGLREGRGGERGA